MLSKIVVLLVALTVVSAIDNIFDPSKPRECFSCSGSNCQRTTAVTVNTTCADNLDICVTIFDEFEVSARGCLSHLDDEHRSKCDSNSLECHKCLSNFCNNLGRADFKCIECDSSKNTKCIDDTSNIEPSRCPVPTSATSYCYVDKREGKTVRGCSVNALHQKSCLGDEKCALCLPEDSEACNGKFNLNGAGTVGVSLVALFSALIVAYNH